MQKNIEQKMDDIIKSVTLEIESRGVKIAPKWHFILKSVLATAAVILVFLICIFFASFLLFKNRMLPPHGMRELATSLELLPWLVISIILFIFGILFLLKSKYNFVYKRSYIFVLLASGAGVILLAFVIDNIQMHDKIGRRVRNLEKELGHDVRMIPNKKSRHNPMREMYKLDSNKDF